MACIVMAFVAMADIVMGCIVMAYMVMSAALFFSKKYPKDRQVDARLQEALQRQEQKVISYGLRSYCLYVVMAYVVMVHIQLWPCKRPSRGKNKR